VAELVTGALRKEKETTPKDKKEANQEFLRRFETFSCNTKLASD
jgi:hypothetical protein